MLSIHESKKACETESIVFPPGSERLMHDYGLLKPRFSTVFQETTYIHAFLLSGKPKKLWFP